MSTWRDSYQHLYGLCLPIAGSALVAILALQRKFLTFGTETDFLGGFIHEADRFMQGQPLAMSLHPPLYSLVLGLVHRATGNWETAGLLVAWCSALVALVASYQLFNTLSGRQGSAQRADPMLPGVLAEEGEPHRRRSETIATAFFGMSRSSRNR